MALFSVNRARIIFRNILGILFIAMPEKKTRKPHISDARTGGEKKHCPRCDEYKYLHNFHKNKQSWDGLAVYCKECKSEIKWSFSCQVAKAHKNGFSYEFLTDKKGTLYQQCTECKINKPITEFYKDSGTMRGIGLRCKFCSKKYSFKYYFRKAEGWNDD
eukprot:scaffold892_cov291-Pavlova_lutheri.AAC.4